VIVAVSRSTGLIVGEAVSQDRGLATLQTVVDSLPSAQRYASDGHTVYAELVWPEASSHVISRGKEETHTIESVNANLRTYLGRLARRSRCFSRSLSALRQALRLFVFHYNQRQRLYLAHPKLRDHLPLLI
jgi:IS1 family transposase